MAAVSNSLLAFIVGLCAVVFHFRLDVAQRVAQVLPGESGMRGAIWANQLQRIGGSGTSGTCCYEADFKRLKKLFCDSGLSAEQDAIPMLGHCTAYVRGRMEFPITMYKRGGYSGNITQGRGGTYIVKEAARDDSSAADKAPESA